MVGAHGKVGVIAEDGRALRWPVVCLAEAAEGAEADAVSGLFYAGADGWLVFYSGCREWHCRFCLCIWTWDSGFGVPVRWRAIVEGDGFEAREWVG